MKIIPEHRKKLAYFLHNFYTYFPNEKYTIFHFVRYMKNRLKINKDAWVGVSGDTGVGKSYLCLMIGILFGRPFDLQKNVTYIPLGDEIIRKFMKLTFQCFIMDEAAKQMRRVQWHDKSQQDVNVTAMTERWKNNFVLMNMPNFSEFTKSMRIGSIIFRLVVLFRNDIYARVIVQRKSRNWRSEDPWGDKLANNIYEKLEKKKKALTNDVILRVERSLPTTIMDFIVPDLNVILPDVTAEYRRLKTASRTEKNLITKTESKNTYYKDKYENLLSVVSRALYNNELDLGKTRVTKQEIAQKLGISVSTFNKYLQSSLNSYTGKPSHHTAVEE